LIAGREGEYGGDQGGARKQKKGETKKKKELPAESKTLTC